MTLDKAKVQQFLKQYTMIIALLIIWILFGALTDGIFLGARNLSNLFRQMTITAFLSCGMLLVIVTGGIDLSVGSVTGFISAIVAVVQAKWLPDLLLNKMPTASIETRAMVSTVIAIFIALLVGALVGLFQGSIIAYVGVPAFIVTLGGMMMFRGGVLGVTGSKTVVPIEEPLRLMAQGYLPVKLGWLFALVITGFFVFSIYNGRRKKKAYGFELRAMWIDALIASLISILFLGYTWIMNSYRGIQLPVLILAVVAFIVHYLANNTRFGRYVYALGGNKEATRLSGIDIKKNILLVHILIGVMCGFAGLILTGYVAAGTTGGGKDYELEAIAACVIGGVSLSGGSGTIIGTIVGALVMASLVNGMSVMNMPIFWQYIIKGVVLILAVSLDVSSKKK